MKRILSAAAVLMCTASFAQNINPTVEVTNTYQGNASEVHKPQLGMAVPDSLLRFDMDFGYEIFEKPYQGAYNFKPYMLSMRLEKDAYRGRELYLRAGAGYSLHPQLDFVYGPEQKGRFQMSVFGSHRSYFGKYNSLYSDHDGDVYKIDKDPSGTFKGRDGVSRLGFEGRYNWDESILTFGVGYDGIFAKDSIFKRSLNAADFNLRFRSNRNDYSYIFYDVAFDGRFAGDKRKPTTGESSDTQIWDNLSEATFGLRGDIGPVLDPSRSILLGFEAMTASNRKLIEGNTGKVALIPKYRMLTGNWDLSLGVRIEKLFSSDEDEPGLFGQIYQFDGSTVFPDVNVSYKARENVILFASVTGGNYLNTYSSIVARHHFINPMYSMGMPFLDNSTEKIDVKIGVRGNAGSKLQFEIDGGAAVHENGLVDSGIPVANVGTSGTTVPLGSPSWSYGNSGLPAVAYSDYSVIYADALFDLKAGGFRLDGGLHLKNMSLKHDEDIGLPLALFTCDLRALYDFSPRLYAGLRAQSSSSRKGYCHQGYTSELSFGPASDTVPIDKVSIPGYLDLGILAGYQFNRKMGFWLESGNLLCEDIQRSPFYSEKDLWITAGITLSL